VAHSRRKSELQSPNGKIEISNGNFNAIQPTVIFIDGKIQLLSELKKGSESTDLRSGGNLVSDAGSATVIICLE